MECVLAILIACIVVPILLSWARKGSNPDSGQGNEGGWR